MFYTYMWLREDGTPYYVGKGSGDRVFRIHRRIGRAPLERVVIYVVRSEGSRRKQSIACKGRIPWNKGLKKAQERLNEQSINS